MECLNPILNVKDIETSKKFYVDILGFVAAEWGDENFTLISKDNTGIYLCKNGQGHAGSWIWMGFDGNIFDLHEMLISNSVTIKQPPLNYSWALEMQVLDPDGHVLRFGTDPDPNKPFLDK